MLEKRKYYGQFDPPVDQFIFERYFYNNTENGTYIECGAFDGVTESSCYFFEKYLNWKAINIEPSPNIYASLKENRKNSLNLNIALSNKNGSSVFTDVNYPGYSLCTNGSLKHGLAHKKWLDSAGCTYVTNEVKTETYSYLIKRLGITKIDLMVLDVEGHELDVISGFDIDEKILPSILCVEVGHIPLDKVNTALKKLGYFYDVQQDVNAYFVLKKNKKFFPKTKKSFFISNVIKNLFKSS